MKYLLGLTAIFESATGLALLLAPALLASLLFGVGLDAPIGLVVARIAGAALLALGVACWVARDADRSRSVLGLVAALLLYNVAATVVLIHAGIGMKLSGVALWPAVMAHVALAFWCMACLRPTKAPAH
jgi:riboflavin transporter FmnP